ncbi:hypothetical protein PAHAL_1G030700 [Panicum hallii]|uniref:Uncharacterized protein n=1 Tax=Panicum hallii TaxID=206008 RepID=A0A2S3GL14_9POAL|nr:uncharacterized protein LOC112879334 isoform X2 [Panicum hallii]PAN03940.1 hypothetical protein PAHAL_1G030700 [Panicum hallii]
MRPPTRPGGAPAGQAGRRLGPGVLRLLQAPAVVALAAALAVSAPAPAAPGPAGASEPLCNLPPTLSGEEGGRQGETNRIRHPKSDRAARCTSKCVSTCVLGGYGAPGVAGPFNIRRPLVVFKDTFRSRQYCLVECSDICNLLKDGEDDQ